MKLSLDDLVYYFCSTRSWSEKDCYPYIKRMQARQFQNDVPADLVELAVKYANSNGETAKSYFDQAQKFCEKAG